MKKTPVSFLIVMAVTSSAWAAETTNIHNQVDNAQAPAHQMQSFAPKNAVQGEGMKMMDMSNHEQAAMSYDMMQNDTSIARQDIADMHKKMMSTKTETIGESVKPFSKMNEHEKAAMVHGKADNGRPSIIHQQQANKHCNQNAQN